MTRAAKLCSHPDCTNPMPCPTHGQKPWHGSQRRTRTLNGWAQQRRAQRVMRRHDGICHVCHRPGSDEVDHVIPLAQGGADTEDNMRPIHGGPDSCHSRKTAVEAALARCNPDNE